MEEGRPEMDTITLRRHRRPEDIHLVIVELSFYLLFLLPFNHFSLYFDHLVFSCCLSYLSNAFQFENSLLPRLYEWIHAWMEDGRTDGWMDGWIKIIMDGEICLMSERVSERMKLNT